MRTKYGFEVRFSSPLVTEWKRLGRDYDTPAEAAMMLSICLEVMLDKVISAEGRLIHIYLPDDVDPAIPIHE